MRHPHLAVPGSGHRRERTAGDAILREVGGWLDAGGARADLAAIAGWDGSTWDRAADVAVAHGIAPHLHATLGGTVLGSILPVRVRDRFAEQHAQTEARSARIHEDLGRILAAAAAAGIAIMPLEGALLTTRGFIDPAVRPLADLDLLVHDIDRPIMLSALLALGYRDAPGPRTPGRDRLLDPGDAHTRSSPTERPDDPPPVELLRWVDKRPWGGRAAYDLTELLWASGRPGTIVGEPAVVPSDELILVHVAAHATMDLVAGTGRLLQWLDIAMVALRVGVRRDTPVPWLVLPSLALARRAFPRSLAGVPTWSGIDPAVSSGLRRWAASVPLDTRAGLSDGTTVRQRGPWQRYWARWRPVPWRLRAGYGGISLPRALVLHARAAARHRRYWKRKAAQRRRA